jgi:O-antigen/teichoic acid export membrane protein
MSTENNQRLVKNTLFMYFRMGITMLVALYSSRVVLNTLGIDDYGIYNVVGGIVVLFTFLNNSLSTATQRYLSIEIGKQNFSRLKEIFNSSFYIYLIVVVLIIILAETVGLWFLNSKMNFPTDRTRAANWVFQFSILTTCISILRAPYNANVIANEKMSFYAYSSILEAILKLIVLYILVILPYDKLITYSILILLITAFITLWYYIHNTRNYSYARIFVKTNQNKELFKELVSFSGWGIFGSIANVGFRQGVNIIINIFFGVGVNAAFGIANQVSSQINQFSGGFQAALNPQLTKTYATGRLEEQNKLIYRSSKFSYFLLLIVGLPVLLNTNYLLTIWLINVPEYTVIFCQLMIVGTMVDSISAPLWVIIFATGKIRSYQIVISVVIMSNVLFSYITARLGLGPEYMLYIRIVLFAVSIAVRMAFLYKLISFNIKNFIRHVLLPIFIVTILVIPLPYWIGTRFNGFKGLSITSTASVMTAGILIYYIGITTNEREFINRIVKNTVNKFYVSKSN